MPRVSREVHGRSVRSDAGRARLWSRLMIVALVVGVAAAAIAAAVTRTVRQVDPPMLSDAAPTFTTYREPVRLLDTRPGGPTVGERIDGGLGAVAGSPIEVAVADIAGFSPDTTGLVLVVTALDGDGSVSVATYPCGVTPPDPPNLAFMATGGGAGQVITGLSAAGSICLLPTADVNLVVDMIASFAGSAFVPQTVTERLLDTRPNGSTFDGTMAAIGVRAPGSTTEIPIADRVELAVGHDVALLSVAAIGEESGSFTVYPCGERDTPTASSTFAADQLVVSSLAMSIDDVDNVCVHTTASVHLVVDAHGSFDSSIVEPISATRLVDTRPDGRTADGRFAGIGVRPLEATLEVPITGRVDVPANTDAVIVSVTAAAIDEVGELTIFTPGATAEGPPTFDYVATLPASHTLIVPIAADGTVCISTTGRTDLVVDVVAWISTGGPTASPPTAEAATGCPDQELFPTWRMVAIYGSARSETLGILGEQEPEAAVARLDEIVATWHADDRPVLGAFNLIATLATAEAGEEGTYNLPSSDDFIQQYLDVARRHGIYLILDLQTGRSDFLTEAKRYERFLREPDVGLALDPEWRTDAPATPGGGHVGQVRADEVNAVADWLAAIVEEEDLPEKLLVVHQFQTDMILDRDDLVEPPGIALTIHMDGHGTQPLKLDTYSRTRVEPPWSNGVKLFFDEDDDLFEPSDFLTGTFEPIPDLLTYQ